MDADVAVVGAGVTGLSLAFFLERAGADVLVLDRTGIAAGASGVQPGGVRQQWSTEVNVRLGAESIDFYADLDDELGRHVDARLDRCGYLFVAHTGGALADMREAVALQNRLGVPSRIVDPAEAGALVPGLVPDSLAGAAWCGDDGYVDRPQAVVEAFAQGIRIEIADVHALRPGWKLHTSAGLVRARAVVAAAGADTRALLAPLGIAVPIEPEPRHLFLSEPVAGRLVEPLVVARELRFAAKHLANGRVLASDLGATGDPEEGRERWRATVARGIAGLLPVLAFVSFPLLASGTYDVTPDHQPIVGPVEEGLWLAAGYSGHGFMLAPAVSRRLAEAILAGRGAPIAEFAPDRFAGAVAAERAIV